jgi:cell division protein FtsB
MKSLFHRFQNLLEHPVKVGVMALAIAFAGLLAQGTLIDLWNLNSEKWLLDQRYRDTLKTNGGLALKINQARNSDKFIGRQAREKLDLIKTDELVFIFENDGSAKPAP